MKQRPTMALAAVFALALAACGSDGDDSAAESTAPIASPTIESTANTEASAGTAASDGTTPPDAPPATINFGTTAPGSVSFQMPYTQEAGYFDDENLTVNIEPLTADLTPLLVNGDLDIIAVTYAQLFQAAAAGVETCVIANLVDVVPGVHELFVQDGSSIQSVADLKGKKIGVGSLGGFYPLTLSELLKSADLTLDDVQLVETPLADMSAILDRGDIDVGVFSGSFKAAMQTQYPTFRKIADLTDAPSLNGLPQQGLVVLPEYYEENADAIDRFLRALTKGSDDLAADPQLNVEAQVTLQPTLSADAAKFVVPRDTFRAPVTAAELQKAIDLQIGSGVELPGVTGEGLICAP